MKNKIRRIVRYTFIILFSAYALFSMYFVYANERRPTYEDCGKIISKSSDEVAIKHGSKTELYLNIQFTKSGFRSVLAGPTTYFKYKVGDYICFDLAKETSLTHAILQTSGFIFYIVVAFVLIMLFIWYILPENWG